ncbi:MAG: ArsA family ATPase [Myxococcaceae bacterium]
MAGLFDKRLVVVSGKGGVGKSSISAAIALAAAKAGKKTLVCEVNAKERITLLLGHPPVGPELTAIDGNLWAVDVRPNEAMREYALMTLRFKAVYNAVFENRFVRYFLRFVPSLQELVMLGKILYHVKETDPDGRPRFDLVVMDAPATGHAISYLSVPQVIIDTVPPGPMSKEAEWMRDLLVDRERTAALLVSLPEEMPVNETLDLYAALQKRVRVPVAASVLNAFIEERFTDDDVAKARAQSPSLGDLVHAHKERADISKALERKLAAGLPVPVVKVPRLYVNDFSRAAIEQIGEHLRPLLTGASA